MNAPDYLQWLNARVAGNELWRLAIFLLLLVVAVGLGRLARALLDRQEQRLRERRIVMAAFCGALARSAWLILVAGGARLGVELLVVPARLYDMCLTSTGVLFTIASAWAAYYLVGVADAWFKRGALRSSNKMDDMLVPLVRTSLRLFVVTLAVLQIATQLSDKPVTSLLAGLGIGGLALALAAQETVKNFFGSLMIFADKPFEIGDRIVVDGLDGPVETVGFRSTRVRTLDGHLVTIPNGELANKLIVNISQRPHIRRQLNLSITYGTPPEKVEEALRILRELLASHEGMHMDFPPRVHFNEFKDAWLGLQVLYWYHPADYWAFMAFSEKLNLEILRRFNQAGIEFAFPTQTIHLAGRTPAPPAPEGAA